MKKAFVILGLTVLFVSCDNDGRSAGQVVDSTLNKLESTAEKVGEKAEQAWDTTKAKAKDVKEDLNEAFDRDKDTGR